VQTFVSNIASDNPQMAVSYLSQITDPDQRNNAIESIAGAWLQSDPASAKHWLMNSGLPDDRIQALLNAPSRPITTGRMID
jgi:hypothetical protein